MKTFQTKTLKAFTLAELIVAVVISAIVLTILVNFITTSMNEVTFSNRQTDVLANVNNLSIDLNNYRSAYGSWSVIYDKSWTGSDILLLRNSENDAWLIAWIVSSDSYTLENTQSAFETISQKHFAVRELSDIELVSVTANPSEVFTYTFNRDKVYEDIVLKDMQVEMYNSGAVIDVDFDILLNYKQWIDGERWDNVNNDWMYRMNLNF